jgi:membrane-bound lytic murein transglycosylase
MMESGTEGNRRYGVPINADIKAAESRRMQMLISRKDGVRYSTYLGTSEVEGKTQAESLAAIKAKAELQLENWREEPHQTGDINKPIRFTHGGKSGGQNDDLAKVILDGGYWPIIDAQRKKHRIFT